MSADRAAIARLQRLRWSLTVSYTAGAAVCLIVLVFIAAAIDTHSRAQALDTDAGRRADAFSRAVWMDKGVLHLEPLSEDELAGAPAATAVLERTGTGPVVIRWVHPFSSSLPGRVGLDGLWTRTAEEQTTFLTTMTGVDGTRLRWAAAPVWDGDNVGAVVLAAADPAPGDAGHRALVRWLAAGYAGLVLALAGAVHLLTGRSMRPALRALKQHEQFLAEAAHELRTPLATLRLVVDAGRSSPARAPAAMADAVRLVDRMGQMVTALLARARVEAGAQQVELIPLRLDQLVEQVVNEWPHGGANISVEAVPTVVRGDPDLLAQAVRNLAENALRHGAPPGQPARVKVRVSAGTVTVRDHGPGIVAADRERIFENRVTGGSSGAGTGIGLAIVRWVAGLHGGTARATEAPGGGASVELHLPEHTS
jgi:signal transduction histidine kinase